MKRPLEKPSKPLPTLLSVDYSIASIQYPKLIADFDGFFLGNVYIYACPTRPALVGCTLRMKNESLVSLNTYLVYTSKHVTIENDSQQLVVTEPSYVQRLKDSLTPAEVKEIIVKMVGMQNLPSELSQIAFQLTCSHLPASIPATVVAGMLPSCDLNRLPLVHVLHTYLVPNKYDEKQKRRLFDLSYVQLHELKQLLCTEPWTLVFGLHKLKGIASEALLDKAVREFGLQFRFPLHIQYAVKMYYKVMRLRLEENHTVFNKGMLNVMIPCMQKEQREALEKQVFEYLQEKALVFTDPLLPASPAAGGGGGGGASLSTANNPFAWLVASLLVATLVAVVLASALIGTKVSDNNGILNSMQSRVTPPVNASCDQKAEDRRNRAYQLRVNAAFDNYVERVPCPQRNNDETLYASQNYFASFSKSLEHDMLGHVNATAYRLLLKAVETGNPSDWERVPRAPGATLQLKNPQASLAFDLMGGDSHSYDVPPAPAFSSAEQAADLVEDYWMAILRDVPFANFSTHPLVAQAVADLNRLSGYTGPKPVTPQNIFRANDTGSLNGPYISQFMYLSYAMGAHSMDQKLSVPVAGINFGTNFSEFLAIQNGHAPLTSLTFDPIKRYIRTGRDLSAFVHVDILYQASFEALMVLQTLGAPVKDGIPYKNTSARECGFSTFGGPMWSTFPAFGSNAALHAAWHYKWNVNRRLRPEVMAGRTHNHLKGLYTYPLHPDLLNSSALPILNATYGGYLLPVAYPELSPAHPSYPAGHNSVSSATISMLRAIFDEDWIIPNPVVPSADGLTLVPYVGPPLTVGGELGKLAANIGIGRNWASV